MVVDCDTCVVKGAACGECVVSVMLGAPPSRVELDEAEQRALAVLADAGIVPRLRLVTADRLDMTARTGCRSPGRGGRRPRLRRIA